MVTQAKTWIGKFKDLDPTLSFSHFPHPPLSPPTSVPLPYSSPTPLYSPCMLIPSDSSNPFRLPFPSIFPSVPCNLSSAPFFPHPLPFPTYFPHILPHRLILVISAALPTHFPPILAFLSRFQYISN